MSLAAMGLFILFSSICPAAPDEAYGTVTDVLDGDTFEVQIEKSKTGLDNRVDWVRLADVDSPQMRTADGPAARDFTYAVVQGKRIYLDIDDQTPTGRDSEGRLICLAYLAGAYGQPLAAPNLNRLLVDSGHARLDNSTENEFDPRYWWEGDSFDGSGGALKGIEQDIKEQLLPKIEESAESALNRAAREMWQWFKAQIGL